jgi:hypothetical protein
MELQNVELDLNALDLSYQCLALSVEIDAMETQGFLCAEILLVLVVPCPCDGWQIPDTNRTQRNLSDRPGDRGQMLILCGFQRDPFLERGIDPGIQPDQLALQSTKLSFQGVLPRLGALLIAVLVTRVVLLLTIKGPVRILLVLTAVVHGGGPPFVLAKKRDKRKTYTSTLLAHQQMSLLSLAFQVDGVEHGASFLLGEQSLKPTASRRACGLFLPYSSPGVPHGHCDGRRPRVDGPSLVVAVRGAVPTVQRFSLWKQV